MMPHDDKPILPIYIPNMGIMQSLYA